MYPARSFIVQADNHKIIFFNMRTEQNKKTVKRFFDEVCNMGKREVINEIFAEEVQFNDKSGTYADVMQYLKEIEIAFDHPNVEVKEQVAEGDFVSTRRIWTGIQKAEYRGQPSTGELMTWTEISIVRFANGKIVKDWVLQGKLVSAKL